MSRNDNWTALNDKAKGDTIPLLLAAYGDEPERLAEGTITKVTSATRAYTMDGALRDGDVQLRSGWWRARENDGMVDVDGARYRFRVATPADIARLTDPNRARREALDDAMRDLRHYRTQHTKEEVGGLIAELEAAICAARELHEAL